MTQRILIVEDEILVAMDLEATLEECGLEPIGIAPDTKSALKLAELHPDIAFVDINLRDGRTGIDIGRRLARDFGVDVIYTSANTDLLGDGIAGTIGYLPKPYHPQHILSALEYLANGKSAPASAQPPRCLNLFAA